MWSTKRNKLPQMRPRRFGLCAGGRSGEPKGSKRARLRGTCRSARAETGHGRRHVTGCHGRTVHRDDSIHISSPQFLASPKKSGSWRATYFLEDHWASFKEVGQDQSCTVNTPEVFLRRYHLPHNSTVSAEKHSLALLHIDLWDRYMWAPSVSSKYWAVLYCLIWTAFLDNEIYAFPWNLWLP